MRTFLLGYLTFLNGIAVTLGTVFVAGMIKGSLNAGHVETAMVSAGAWFAILPLLICATIMGCQSFTGLLSKRRP